VRFEAEIRGPVDFESQHLDLVVLAVGRREQALKECSGVLFHLLSWLTKKQMHQSIIAFQNPTATTHSKRLYYRHGLHAYCKTRLSICLVL